MKLNNKGEKDITNFAWTEFGGGWGNPKWLDTDVELDDGQSKDYTVDFVVTNQPQKYVFAANVHGDMPKYELNKTNNSLVIIVAPDGVDLAASIVPTQKTYRARSFPYMTACNVSGIRLDNGVFEVPAVINVTLSDGLRIESLITPSRPVASGASQLSGTLREPEPILQGLRFSL